MENQNQIRCNSKKLYDYYMIWIGGSSDRLFSECWLGIYYWNTKYRPVTDKWREVQISLFTKLVHV